MHISYTDIVIIPITYIYAIQIYTIWSIITWRIAGMLMQGPVLYIPNSDNVKWWQLVYERIKVLDMIYINIFKDVPLYAWIILEACSCITAIYYGMQEFNVMSLVIIVITPYFAAKYDYAFMRVFWYIYCIFWYILGNNYAGKLCSVILATQLSYGLLGLLINSYDGNIGTIIFVLYFLYICFSNIFSIIRQLLAKLQIT